MISQKKMAASGIYMYHRDREHFPTSYPGPLEEPSSVGILQSSLMRIFHLFHNLGVKLLTWIPLLPKGEMAVFANYWLDLTLCQVLSSTLYI